MVNEGINTKALKEEIIKFLILQKDRVAHESALFLQLNINNSKMKKDLRKVLNKMVIDGSISFDKKKRFIRLKTNEYEIGEIILKGVNDYSIQFKGKRESVKSKYLNGSYVGDKVLYSNKTKSICSIVEKKNNPVIFSCIRINNETKFLPLTLPGFEEFRFSNIDSLKFNGNEIISAYAIYNEEDECYDCIINEVIGNGSDEDIKGKIILAANGYEINFPQEVLKEVDLIPKKVYEEDMAGRVDLRNLKSFTLDDAKRMNTFDDALSVEINDDGHYMVYFHISDVPHYVKPGTALYEEARRRSEKVYLHGLHYARNMLPEKLSHGICSFIKGEDRLAKTFSFEFDRDGELLAYDFIDSVVNVKENFFTGDADDIYDAGYDPSNKAFNPEYIREFVLLKKINSFIKKEPFIGVNSSSDDSMHGVLINIIEYVNERVANHFPTLPFIYKTFKYPTKKEISKRAAEIDQEEWKPINHFNYVKSAIIEKILTYYRLPHTSIYESAVADILTKECCTFSSKNKGHFKYGVPRYTHVNSPVRSFPNLVNLCLFDKYNSEFDCDVDTMVKQENDLDDLCKQYNENHQKIDRLESYCSNPKENDKELQNASQGKVVDKKGGRLLVHIPSGGMYRVYSNDPSIDVGSELIIRINRSPNKADRYNAKILYYKNTNKNS